MSSKTKNNNNKSNNRETCDLIRRIRIRNHVQCSYSCFYLKTYFLYNNTIVFFKKMRLWCFWRFFQERLIAHSVSLVSFFPLALFCNNCRLISKHFSFYFWNIFVTLFFECSRSVRMCCVRNESFFDNVYPASPLSLSLSFLSI